MSSVLALTGTILATIQIARDVAKLLRAISDVDDPRIRIIQGKLTNERRLTVAWANRIRLESAGNWNIPPESVKEVETILAQMRLYFKRAESKMTKILKDPGGKMTGRVFMRRFWFAYGGFEELRDLTEVLATMNQTLMIIAPPLPHYSSLNMPASSRPDATAPNTASVIPADVAELTIPDSQGPGKSQASLFSKCLDVLAMIAREIPHNQSLETHHLRLEQWGQGLFGDDPISLNTIFASDPEGNETLIAVLTRALVYIAVIEERVLAYLCEQKTKSQRTIENQRTEVTAMLGRDAFVEVALENWAALQAASINGPLTKDNHLIQEEIGLQSEKDTSLKEQQTQELPDKEAQEVRFEFGVDVNHLDIIESQTRELEGLVRLSIEQDSNPEPLSALDVVSRDLSKLDISVKDNTIPGAFDYLRRIVELLFDLLPAIRSVRRARLLEIESEEGPKIASEAEMTERSITEKPSFDDKLELVLKRVEELETLLKNDESWAEENGHMVEVYTPLIGKERERIAEYRQARKKRKVVSIDESKVMLAIDKLDKQLSKTTHDIEVKGKPGSMQIADIKFSDVDTNKKIGDALEALSASSTLFWNDLPPAVS